MCEYKTTFLKENKSYTISTPPTTEITKLFAPWKKQSIAFEFSICSRDHLECPVWSCGKVAHSQVSSVGDHVPSESLLRVRFPEMWNFFHLLTSRFQLTWNHKKGKRNKNSNANNRFWHLSCERREPLL